MGSRHSANALRLREFLTRNEHPYTYIDLDTDKTSQELLDRFDVKLDEIPVIICSARSVLRNPSIQELAECLGLNSAIDESQVRDLIIVGAGPSGLAAAVYAASEGLDVLVIETEAPGGQAGSSSKIENYLGFPTGVSGQELAARATTQAQKFGAKMMISRSVAKLNCGRRPYEVVLDDGRSIPAHAIVIASGARYNKPNIANLKQFEGQGVYYGATYIESQLCEKEDVLDSKGFIVTGRDLDTAAGGPPWPLPRTPQMLETSLPGVFAVGDVRSGSVKRVASSVGEGAIAIHLVHGVLADL